MPSVIRPVRRIMKSSSLAVAICFLVSRRAATAFQVRIFRQHVSCCSITTLRQCQRMLGPAGIAISSLKYGVVMCGCAISLSERCKGAVKKIKVMLVDDSAVVRQVLMSILQGVADIEVIGVASDPIFAMEKLNREWPDVIVLDVEMPRMDGITFLKKIMAERPTPVVICSTLTEKGAETTLQALSLGAVDIITKPRMGLRGFLEESAENFIMAIRAAAHARVGRARVNPNPAPLK